MLYWRTWPSPGISNLCELALQLKKQTQECSSALLPPTAIPLALCWHKCCLAVWWGRLGNRSSWELAWDFGTTWMLLLVRGPPCLCNEWAAETQHGPVDGTQASWVSFRRSQLLAFIWATQRLSCEQEAPVSLMAFLNSGERKKKKCLEPHRSPNQYKWPTIKSGARGLGMGVEKLSWNLKSPICTH